MHTTEFPKRSWVHPVRRLLSKTIHPECHPECVPANPPLPSPAPEILDYLARHPEAQDTLDGILYWWVLDSCVKRWAPRIAETVAKLVERGFLEEKASADGKTFYRVSPSYLSTLQQVPTGVYPCRS